MVRNERFSEEYQSEVKSVVELVSTYIVQRYKEIPVEARAANTALAHFLKVVPYGCYVMITMNPVSSSCYEPTIFIFA